MCTICFSVNALVISYKATKKWRIMIHSGKWRCWVHVRAMCLHRHDPNLLPEIDWARGDGLTSHPPFLQLARAVSSSWAAKRGHAKKYFGEKLGLWERRTYKAPLCTAHWHPVHFNRRLTITRNGEETLLHKMALISKVMLLHFSCLLHIKSVLSV